MRLQHVLFSFHWRRRWSWVTVRACTSRTADCGQPRLERAHRDGQEVGTCYVELLWATCVCVKGAKDRITRTARGPQQRACNCKCAILFISALLILVGIAALLFWSVRENEAKTCPALCVVSRARDCLVCRGTRDSAQDWRARTADGTVLFHEYMRSRFRFSLFLCLQPTVSARDLAQF